MNDNDLNELRQHLDIIDGAISDVVGGRPIEDVIGEIGNSIDRARAILPPAQLT